MADLYKFELSGVTSFKMGDPGAAGVMGAVLTQYLGVKEGTMTFDIAAPTTNDINIEESDYAYSQQLSGSPKSFTFELFGLKLSEIEEFLGGTFTAGSLGTKDKWEAPVTIPDINQSVEITSKDGDGQEVVYSFVKCRISGAQTQTNTKTDLIGLQVTCAILQPVDASGDPLTPYFFEGETVT